MDRLPARSASNLADRTWKRHPACDSADVWSRKPAGISVRAGDPPSLAKAGSPVIANGDRAMNIPLKPQTSQPARALAGKVALVTGSTSGIGLGIARALAAAGADDKQNGLGVASEIGRTREQIAAEFGVK